MNPSRGDRNPPAISLKSLIIRSSITTDGIFERSFAKTTL